MTSAVESESRIANWQQNKGLLVVKQDIQKNSEALVRVRQKLSVCRNVRLNVEPQLDRLRADQLLHGQENSKEYERLARTIADAETQIVLLERDERLLLDNHERLESALKTAKNLAKNVARERLYAACQEKHEQLKALVLEATAVNADLMALEAEIKANELGEGGSKQFMLFARYPVSWNAVSPLPITGRVVTHVETWLAHTKQIFGD